jgi:hypothetical protein
MKKWIIGFLVIVCLAIGSVYIFIPSVIVVSEVQYIKTFRAAVAKLLTSKEKMGACLQTIAIKKDSSFTYNGFDLSISRIIFNGNVIRVSSDDIDVQSNLIPLEIALDSSSLYWVADIKASADPLTRIKQYNAAKKLKTSMSALLGAMKIYLEHPSNMYGVEIKEIQLKDSVLISTRTASSTEPGVTDVYLQVKKLQDYAAANKVTVTNSPMLHVQKKDPTHYEFMVGLPIDKRIPETKDIRIKAMPYNGNMLTAEIKGGPGNIKNGLRLMDVYKEDSKRTSPAIPFELMITNRAAEPDTAKWVTKLYYPVM